MNDLKSMKSLNEAVLKVMTNNVDLKDDIDEHYIQEDINAFIAANYNTMDFALNGNYTVLISGITNLIRSITQKDIVSIIKLLPGITAMILAIVYASKQIAKREAAKKHEFSFSAAAKRAAAEREAADPDTIFNSYDLESFNSGDSLQELNFSDIKGGLVNAKKRVMSAASTISKLVRLIKPLYKLKNAIQKNNLEDIIYYGDLIAPELTIIRDATLRVRDTFQTGEDGKVIYNSFDAREMGGQNYNVVLEDIINNVDLKDNIDEHYIHESVKSAIKNQFDRLLRTNKKLKQLDYHAQRAKRKAASFSTAIIVKFIDAIKNKDILTIYRLLPVILAGLITLVKQNRQKAERKAAAAPAVSREVAAAEAAAVSLQRIAKHAAMDPNRQRQRAERKAAVREAADPNTLMNSYDLESFISGDSLQEIKFSDIKGGLSNIKKRVMNKLVRLVKPLNGLKTAMEKDKVDDIIWYGEFLVVEFIPIYEIVPVNPEQTKQLNNSFDAREMGGQNYNVVLEEDGSYTVYDETVEIGDVYEIYDKDDNLVEQVLITEDVMNKIKRSK